MVMRQETMNDDAQCAWKFRVILGASWVDINDNLRSSLDQQSPHLALMETQVPLMRLGHLFLLPSLPL